MRFEVTWMTHENDWITERQEQCFTSEQFSTHDEALAVFNDKKKDIEVEHVRLSLIMNEFSR